MCKGQKIPLSDIKTQCDLRRKVSVQHVQMPRSHCRFWETSKQLSMPNVNLICGMVVSEEQLWLPALLYNMRMMLIRKRKFP